MSLSKINKRFWPCYLCKLRIGSLIKGYCVETERWMVGRIVSYAKSGSGNAIALWEDGTRSPAHQRFFRIKY